MSGGDAPAAEAPRLRRLHVEGLIAVVLFWGGLLSIGLMLVGLALHAARGGFRGHVLDLHRVAPPGHAREVFVSLADVLHGLVVQPVDPLAIVALGLVVLLVTPVLGVALAIPGFLAGRDYRYAAIAVFVFTLLVVSALVSGGVG